MASSQEPLGTAVANDEIVIAYADLIDAIAVDEPDQAGRLTISFRVQRGDTLATLFATASVERKQADKAIAAIRGVFDPKKLNIGNEVTVALTEGRDGVHGLQGITIWLGGERYIEVIREADGRYAAQRTSQLSIIQEPANLTDLLHIEINRGDTLATLLFAAGVSVEEIDLSVRALRQQFNPKKLKVEHEIFLSLDSGAELLGFALKLADGKYITVVRDSSGRYLARRSGQPTLPKASVNAALAPDPEVTTGHDGETEMAAIKPDESPESESARHRTINVYRPGNSNPIETATSPTANIAIEKGDTLMEALLRGGADNGDAHSAIAAFEQVLNPRKLQIGQLLAIAFDDAEAAGTNVMTAFSLQLGPAQDILVERLPDGSYMAGVVEEPIELIATRTQGTIESSLYVAAIDAGMPVSVLMELIRAFSFDVDFQREIQKGNTFEVLFDRVYTTDGELVREGPMRYAALTLGGKTLELFRYELADGRVDYFDAKGQSVRKALLRTPIDGARLSSTYGMREHPILGYSTMHRGADFAAPSGTPIMAAGDGVIEKARRNGGYGKYVRVRHNSTYKTAYAHLSKYGPDIKEGKRVSQGDIIGYVGSTGRSTGPHLHYEVLVGGTQINPLSVKLPTIEKLEGAELAYFQETRQSVLAELETLPTATRVAQKDDATR